MLLAAAAAGALLMASRLTRSPARAPAPPSGPALPAGAAAPSRPADAAGPPAGAGTEGLQAAAGGAASAGGAVPTGGTVPPGGAVPAGAAVERLTVKVLAVRPHDPTAYTQGLVWDHGTLYESAGLYGRSSLRQVDPQTGEVLRRLDLPPGFFAEGLAEVGDRLIQLTWKEGVAFVYDRRKFERTGEYHYEGEGWGLCDDGRRLVMSDGSERLTFRDRRTFAPLGGVDVHLDGRPARQLNELECVGGAVYANVWMTDQVLRIDPGGGRVTAVIDAGGLLSAAERAGADVLNGIAYDARNKRFLLTGKLWPKLFEVVFVPAGGGGHGPPG
jgi:glutaminyl-peptide cyclotransferase